MIALTKIHNISFLENVPCPKQFLQKNWNRNTLKSITTLLEKKIIRRQVRVVLQLIYELFDF